MRFCFRCTRCGRQAPFGLEAGRCPCGGSWTVEYDLEWVRREMTKERLQQRPATMWRYAELLPIRRQEHIVTLGEGWTPLIRLQRGEASLPIRRLWVKREEQNPTGSFKARGFSAAVTIAREHGIRKVAVNSNGNAASALAAYAARAGMETYVFLPKDCPGLIVEECAHYGAHTYLVDGYIHDAGQIIADGMQEQGWYHVGTLREPGRAEGKKTMGLELAEQLGWKLPDVIIYPTGGGSGIIGMWNAFQQLKAMGFVEGDLPRFVSVQEVGCAPLAQAMAANAAFTPHPGEAASAPTGMRVPHPPDGNWLVHILRSTGGTAVAVTREDIADAQNVLGRHGISASPEGAATWAGFVRLLDQGWIRPHEKAVLFNTSHAMKYWPWNGLNRPAVKSYPEWLERFGPSPEPDGSKPMKT